MSVAESSISRNLAVTKADTFSNFITGEGVKRKINEMMGGKKGEQFITSVVSAVTNNPALAECDRGTILSAAMQGAALDLSPSPVLGHYYLVPYNRKDAPKAAQFQIGYKGYIQLAIRSGQYRRINVLEIRDGELKAWNPMTENIMVEIIEDDEVRENLPVVGYYAMFELTNGFQKAMYWSKKKMEQHADRYSKAFSLDSFKKLQAGQIPKGDMWKYSSFWYVDFDEMAFKTMLRRLLSKWGVMSIELQTAIDRDMSVIDSEGRVSYIDNDLGDAFGGNANVVDVEETPASKQKEESPQVESAGDPVDDFFGDQKSKSMSFAQVNAMLVKAKTLDELDLAADNIRFVEKDEYKDELRKVYEGQRAKFEA